MTGRAIIQHYVPQFLLRNFANPKKQVCAYDKHTKCCVVANVKNVAAERGFYDFNFSGLDVSLEGALSRLETESRRVLEKLIATERILSLSTDDKVATARFVALQLVRTRKQREMSSCLERELFEKIKKMHPDFDEAVLDGKDVEANSRISSLRMLLSFDEFTPHIYNKDFVLFKAPEGHKFYISDSPVVLNNRKSFGPYGNLGLAVPGIEIYMPLSSTLCMGLLSQTIRKDMLEALSEFSMLSVVAINSYAEATKEARRFMDAFSGQGAYVCSAENVMFLNSLQASFSARYVFCEENKFELVERMLKDDPSMKNGLLPSVM